MVDLLRAYQWAKTANKTVELKLVLVDGAYTCEIKVGGRKREFYPQEAAQFFCRIAKVRPLEVASKRIDPSVDFLDVLLLDRYKKAGITRLPSA